LPCQDGNWSITLDAVFRKSCHEECLKCGSKRRPHSYINVRTTKTHLLFTLSNGTNWLSKHSEQEYRLYNNNDNDNVVYSWTCFVRSTWPSEAVKGALERNEIIHENKRVTLIMYFFLRIIINGITTSTRKSLLQAYSRFPQKCWIDLYKYCDRQVILNLNFSDRTSFRIISNINICV
jgi:hypothetical protein